MSGTAQQKPDGPVKDWMNQYLPPHGVFRSDGFHTQRARDSQAEQKRTKDFTNDFCNIMQQYENTLSTQFKNSRVNIRDTHSWDEVVQVAKNTEAAYLAEAKKGTKGVVRRYLRQFCDYSATARPWVGLLPNDQYFSVLCGGLKVVLGITARRSERRIEIFEAFESLPTVIEKTQRCHEIFPDSLTLRDRALTVYFDLLTMIEAMIACLMDKTLLSRIKDGLRGPLADQDLDEKKRRLQMSIEALEEQVNYLHISSSAKTNASIATMGPRVHHLQEMVLDIDKTTRITQNTAETVFTGINGLRSNINSHEQETQMLRKEIELQRQAIELQSQAQNQLSSLLHDVIKNAEWYTARMQRVYDAVDRKVDLRSLQVQLQSLLGCRPEDSSQDLDLVIRNAQSLDTQSQGAMHWALQSPRFQQWIQGPQSDILAVEGNFQDAMARYAATSLLCGMIIQSLRTHNGVNVLHFFCGSHTSKFDPSAGPGGLIQSLIFQLLSTQQFDVGFLRFGRWEEGLKSNSIQILCRLFQRLVEQLPDSIVFIFIDGTSVYEVDAWIFELQLVLHTLLEAVTSAQVSARLKVLITTASRGRLLTTALDERDRLVLPTDTGRHQFLTRRAIDFELSR